MSSSTLAQSSSPSAECSLSPTPVQPSAVAQPAPADGLHAHILLVEDDAPCARLLAMNLSTVGHNVHVVACAEAARQAIAADAWDLVVIDVCLPDTDGLELTCWMRAQDNECRRCRVPDESLRSTIVGFLPAAWTPAPMTS